MKTFVIFAAWLLSASAAISQPYDWSGVESAFGKKGTVQDNIFKITFPRYDLVVKVGDFTVSPAMGLSTWVGLMNMGDHTVMMGDMVVSDQEVPAVLSKMVAEGLTVTALHNHLLNESPVIKYLHFSGSGDAVVLARKIKSVIGVTSTPLVQPVAKAPSVNPDWSAVEAVLGTSGKHNGDLLQYAFARNEILQESGMVMPASMGLAIAINFQMEKDKAGITGDFVLVADEVNPVVKTLTGQGITVTAIHNHMLYDN